MKIVACKYLGNIQGITLAPFCILVRPDKINDEKVLRHELKHWAQARRLWYLVFYVSYFIQWIFKGYEQISFEVEARNAERI